MKNMLIEVGLITTEKFILLNLKLRRATIIHTSQNGNSLQYLTLQQVFCIARRDQRFVSEANIIWNILFNLKTFLWILPHSLQIAYHHINNQVLVQGAVIDILLIRQRWRGDKYFSFGVRLLLLKSS